MNEWIYQSKQNENLGHDPAKKWKSFLDYNKRSGVARQ